MSKFICLLVILAVSLCSIYAGEDDKSPHHKDLDIRAMIDECLKKYGLTDADLKDVVVNSDVSKINACFFGCYYKKVGLLNDKGQYDSTTYLANLKDGLKDDSNYAFMKEETVQCEYVKDKAVSDGEAGCEMGALIADCTIKYEEDLYNATES